MSCGFDMILLQYGFAHTGAVSANIAKITIVVFIMVVLSGVLLQTSIESVVPHIHELAKSTKETGENRGGNAGIVQGHIVILDGDAA